MQGLAALRASAALVCLPLVVAACGGSTALVPGAASAVQQSVVAVSAPSNSRAVARLPVGVHPAGCTPFGYPAPDLPPACTIYLGGFISPTHGESPAQQIASTASFEQQIGRPLALDLHYYQWTDAFPSIGENDDYANKRVPFDSWHCGATDYDVVAGTQDALIARRAQAIAAYGHPIFLRYKWEMNLTYNPKCEDPLHDGKIDGKIQYNPTYFIAAWQHIRAVFAANGANNVVWVFNPSSSGAPPLMYYPGDSQVDWVAFDHYDTNMLPFAGTFQETEKKNNSGGIWTYPYFSTKFPTKPIIVGETGISSSGQQGFLGQADTALQLNFPQIQAFVYWDSTGVRGQYQLLQYGIDAYAQFAAGPYEQGMYQY